MKSEKELLAKKVGEITGVPFNGKTESGLDAYLKRFDYVIGRKEPKLRSPHSQPTEKQMEYIKAMEKDGAPKFRGKTSLSAAYYIDVNRKQLKLTVSDKQKKALSMCKDYLGVEFQGKSYGELQDFLDTYMPAAVEQYKIKKYKQNHA